MNGKRLALAAGLSTLALGAAACSSSSETSTGGTTGGSTAASDLTIGFLYVGPKDDYGYNQAAYEGSLAVQEAFPDATILQAENVPETAEAETVMEGMIEQGADIIFPTSYGHLEFAANVAKDHPDTIFVHQGGLEGEDKLDNLGTYFGTVYEPVYTAGVAAGEASETGKLGYVYAFPIPQTLANINAFALGAQSVNLDAEVIAVSTGSWCDPGLQAQAAKSLIDQGADVLTQHQDCTKTVIETAEAAGAYSVGYHYDASELAPEGWLTGSEWAWTDLYTDIVETAVAGGFVSSPYNGDYRFGYRDVDAPFVAFQPSAFGSAVTSEVQEQITAAYDSFFADADGDGVGDFSVFTGPISDRDGAVRIEEGVSPDYTELDGFFSEPWFVAGVEGSLG